MLRKLNASSALLALSLLAGCSTTQTISTGSRDVCLLLPPVKYHAKTTDPDTVSNIRTNNAKRDAYCNGK